MGGYMTYNRLRLRNQLADRKPLEDPDPYWRDVPARPGVNWHGLCGDMNRMERDYLAPPDLGGSTPAEDCAEAIGIDVEQVRAVLRFVFMDQP